MRTAHIEAVLGPVADAISDFLIAQDDAKKYGVPLGDMYPAAETVAANVQTLAATAAKAQAVSVDEVMAKEMPLATKEVNDACKRLLDATLNLRDDPSSAAEQKNMVLAAEGILHGTRHVLEVFDDYEVRKIVKACDVAEAQVSALRGVAGIEDLLEIMQPSAQSLVMVAQLAGRRVADLLEPWLKEKLEESKEAVRTSSSLLVSSMKAFVTNPQQQASVDAKNANLDRLSTNVAEIRRIVLMPAPPPQVSHREAKAQSGISAARVNIDDALMSMFAAVTAGDAEGLQAALDKYGPAAADLIAAAMGRVNLISDPARKLEIKTSADRLASLKGQLEAAARKAMANPNDAAAQQALLDIMKDIDEESSKLARFLDTSSADDITRTLASIGDASSASSAFGKMLAAARAGDLAATQSAIAMLTKDLTTLRSAASYAAAASSDPVKARAVEDALARLESLKPQIEAAARLVAANPNDPAAREYLAALTAEWESGVLQLNKALLAVQPAADIIGANRRLAMEDLESMKDAIDRQDAEKMRVAKAAMGKKVQAVVDVAEAEISNSTSAAYQNKLRDEITGLSGALAGLNAKADAAFAAPKDAAAAAALAEASKLVLDKMAALEATVANNSSSIAPARFKEVSARAEAAKAAQAAAKAAPSAPPAPPAKPAVVVVRGPAPREPTAEELKANPIKASAMSLRVEASKWSADGNVIVSTSALLAEKFSRLSDLAASFGNGATPESKLDFIRVAKEIAQDVKAVEAEARKIAKQCTDKRLADDLIATVDRIPTISTQLKILAMVKASSPDDADNELLLVQCAQNLMGAVKTTIASTQAAHLRMIDSATNAESLREHWRHQMYVGESVSLASLMTGVTEVPATVVRSQAK